MSKNRDKKKVHEAPEDSSLNGNDIDNEDQEDILSGDKLSTLESRPLDADNNGGEDQVVVLDMDEAPDTPTEMDKLVEEALKTAAGKKAKAHRYREEILRLAEEKVKLAAEKDKLYAELYGLKTRLQKAKEELGESLDLVKRQQAEFQNYRRRVERDKSAWTENAQADFMKDLIPLMDDFERAMKSFTVENAEEYHKGVQMIYAQLLNLLKRYGLEEIEAVGKEFDPNYHDAVMREEREDLPNNTNLDALQKGFTFKGKTLRPSMVKVAVHPSEVRYPPSGDAAAGEAEPAERKERQAAADRGGPQESGDVGEQGGAPNAGSGERGENVGEAPGED
jgi:molecular chaperone GrpE